MALLFMDGFDKVGSVNSNGTVVAGLLAAGEWTNATGSGITIVAGLSATGQAAQIALSASTLGKTLPANYGRLIGGFRFNVTIMATGNAGGISFLDGGTSQCTLVVNPISGLISLRNAGIVGTTLGVSTIAVSVGSTHYLEWDITFGNAGAYSVWMDGSLLFSGTGDTTSTANNTASGILFLSASSGPTIIFDDLYLFDTTGATNNAVLLTSPRVETQFPTSDGAVQFAIGTAILGSATQRGGSNYSAGANNLYVRSFIPSVNCTLNAVVMLPAATNAAIQLRPVVYTDNAGVPNTLMSAGSTIMGMTNGAYLTLPLTTPQTLAAGTRYWLGVMNDISIGLPTYVAQDASLSARFVLSTFASGAPGTCPTTISGQNAAVIFGVVTSPSNSYCVSQNPSQGNFSYVYDTVTGHQDLYAFPALSVVPTTIYAVAAKAAVAKSDAGARTLSVRLKSGATDSSSGTQTIGMSYGWVSSLHSVDPATGAAWTTAGANAAQIGVRVE